MKEIGGYFELEHFGREEYYKDLVTLISGRACLQYLIRAKKINHIYLPEYLCDCVSDICRKEGIRVSFYSIGEDFLPIESDLLDKQIYLYFVNYYGRFGQDIIVEWKKKYPNLIVDNTHAFFQKPISGVDTLYSCRKFFGVPDGAYLHTESRLEEPIQQSTSMNRMGHLLGRFEKTAEAYYEVFKKNDESLSVGELESMSKLTQNLLRGIDYDKVRTIRNRNYSYLGQFLDRMNLLDSCDVDGAFCYPFFHQKGEYIRQKLIEHKIFVPVYWPNVLNSSDFNAVNYAKNIVPLPCDQRYTEEDMEKIIKIIFSVLNKRMEDSV